jgi:hypothetical protein
LASLPTRVINVKKLFLYNLKIFDFLSYFSSIIFLAYTCDERLYGAFYAVWIRVNRSRSRASQKRDEHFDQEFAGCM